MVAAIYSMCNSETELTRSFLGLYPSLLDECLRYAGAYRNRVAQIAGSSDTITDAIRALLTKHERPLRAVKAALLATVDSIGSSFAKAIASSAFSAAGLSAFPGAGKTAVLASTARHLVAEHGIVAAVFDRDTYQAKHGNALSPPAISKLWEDDMVAYLAGAQDGLGGAGGEGRSSVLGEATAASAVTPLDADVAAAATGGGRRVVLVGNCLGGAFADVIERKIGTEMLLGIFEEVPQVQEKRKSRSPGALDFPAALFELVCLERLLERDGVKNNDGSTLTMQLGGRVVARKFFTTGPSPEVVNRRENRARKGSRKGGKKREMEVDESKPVKLHRLHAFTQERELQEVLDVDTMQAVREDMAALQQLAMGDDTGAGGGGGGGGVGGGTVARPLPLLFPLSCPNDVAVRPGRKIMYVGAFGTGVDGVLGVEGEKGYVGRLATEHAEVGRMIESLRAVDPKRGLALMDGHITIAWMPKPDRFARLLAATTGGGGGGGGGGDCPVFGAVCAGCVACKRLADDSKDGKDGEEAPTNDSPLRVSCPAIVRVSTMSMRRSSAEEEEPQEAEEQEGQVGQEGQEEGEKLGGDGDEEKQDGKGGGAAMEPPAHLCFLASDPRDPTHATWGTPAECACLHVTLATTKRDGADALPPVISKLAFMEIVKKYPAEAVPEGGLTKNDYWTTLAALCRTTDGAGGAGGAAGAEPEEMMVTLPGQPGRNGWPDKPPRDLYVHVEVLSKPVMFEGQMISNVLPQQPPRV